MGRAPRFRLGAGAQNTRPPSDGPVSHPRSPGVWLTAPAKRVEHPAVDRAWHVAFMACFPGALVLAVNGQWIAAAVVFLVGIPLFWSLRNRARIASYQPPEEPSSVIHQTSGIPMEVAARLSSSNLDDVPAEVRVGSPRDASDREVTETLSRVGELPANTNFGVVYRACFAPIMDEGEVPVAIRFGIVASSSGQMGSEVKFAESEDAWILISSEAVRWHWLTDRVPGMPPRTPLEALLPGLREARFTHETTIKAGDVQEGPPGIPVRPVIIKSPEGDREWRHLVMLPADPSTDRLIGELVGRSGGVNPREEDSPSVD